jgi:hypothetical protein
VLPARVKYGRAGTKLALPVLLGVLCFAQQGADPWSKSALLDPAALAPVLRSASARRPVILCVAFPVLYRARHIPHAILAGPTSRPEGMDALKKAVAGMAKDSDIVIYCGCCPMDKCPNVRPAFQALKEMGFTRVRVLNIPTNMFADWYSKDYPSEPGSAAGGR